MTMNYNLKNRVMNTLRKLPYDKEKGINAASIGGALKFEGIDFQAYGYKRLTDFIAQFNDVLYIYNELNWPNPPVYYVKFRELHRPLAVGGYRPAKVRPETRGNLTSYQKNYLSKVLVETIIKMGGANSKGVNISDLCNELLRKGINYKDYGFSKFKAFLDCFRNVTYCKCKDGLGIKIYYAHIKDTVLRDYL